MSFPLPPGRLPRPAAPPAHITQVPGAAAARPAEPLPPALQPRANSRSATSRRAGGGGPARPSRRDSAGGRGCCPRGAGPAPRPARPPPLSYPAPTSASAVAAGAGRGPGRCGSGRGFGPPKRRLRKALSLRDASAPPAAGPSRGVAGVRAPGAASSGAASSAPGLSPRSGRAPGPSLRHLPPLLPAVTARARPPPPRPIAALLARPPAPPPRLRPAARCPPGVVVCGAARAPQGPARPPEPAGGSPRRNGPIRDGKGWPDVAGAATSRGRLRPGPRGGSEGGASGARRGQPRPAPPRWRSGPGGSRRPSRSVGVARAAQPGGSRGGPEPCPGVGQGSRRCSGPAGTPWEVCGASCRAQEPPALGAALAVLTVSARPPHPLRAGNMLCTQGPERSGAGLKLRLSHAPASTSCYIHPHALDLCTPLRL
ncbi:basic proline-rich protein-like [Camarhynchus parvulus]|uniref:basic proline-rich protein-like n=1 Tax=Geospiza parvula TaxID=87175 RepID=UPI001237C544|nr:basic proline-rich protein-like [Camarhynchus parvulus]